MYNDLSYLQGFLTSVAGIDKGYAVVRKMKEESGVLYNVFDVLGLTADEVGLHSTFIASLLSPGRHGAGKQFLEAFLRMPGLKLPEGFLDTEKVRVERELYIGPKTDKTGGRIDLFLTDGVNSLIIENKIYAEDQEHQLLRYHNFKPNGHLVYLSLYEDVKPSESSLGGLPPELVICISYRYDIIQWLRECVRIAANLPYIRETINQYINTIQLLTDTDMGTNAEIVKLLKKPENLSSAFAVRDNLNTSINEIVNAFLANLKEGLKKAGLPFICTTEERDWFESYAGFKFIHPDWKDIRFATEFEAVGLRRMAIGFVKNQHVMDIRQLEGAVELAKRLGYRKATASWLWGYPSESCCMDWSNAESMQMLIDGRMSDWFIRTLNDVIEKSEGLSL